MVVSGQSGYLKILIKLMRVHECDRPLKAEARAEKLSEGTLVEDCRIQESLRRIVAGFTQHPQLQQDLMQECLVCLWQAECEQPGRTKSWYLQHCRFHVQHWLDLGRSVDSRKRDNGQTHVTVDETNPEVPINIDQLQETVPDEVCVRDLVSVLSKHLSRREQVVLNGLAEGFPLREVAARFKLSYPSALKYRRRIASLASKLGVLRPAGANPRNGRRPVGQAKQPSFAQSA